MYSIHTFRYSLIRAAWGIQVEITGQLVPGLVGDTPAQAGENLWLSCSSKFTTVAEFDALVVGAMRMAPEVQPRLGNQLSTVVVSNIEYIETDFQVEGLSMAIIGWLIEEFDLEPPKIDISFNRELNQYVFDGLRLGQ